jgi:hypothetical protein
MVAINLIGGNLTHRLDEAVDISSMIRRLCFVIDGAMQPKRTQLREETNHFPKLERVTLGRRVVA